MSAIDYSRTDPFAATRPTIVNRTVAWAADALRAWKNRREFYRLAELTDVELHDIGLTRSDLVVASNSNLTYDPTANLAKVARCRINRMELRAR